MNNRKQSNVEKYQSMFNGMVQYICISYELIFILNIIQDPLLMQLVISTCNNQLPHKLYTEIILMNIKQDRRGAHFIFLEVMHDTSGTKREMRKIVCKAEIWEQRMGPTFCKWLRGGERSPVIRLLCSKQTVTIFQWIFNVKNRIGGFILSIFVSLLTLFFFSFKS